MMSRATRNSKSISFNKMCELYLEYSKTNKRPNSYRRDTMSVKHLLAYFKHYALRQITPQLVEKYKAHRKPEIYAIPRHKNKDEKDVPMCSLNRELAMLKHMFNIAIKWGKTDKNPAAGVSMFREKSRDRVLSDEELVRLLKCASDRLRNILIFAINTGCRLGEILSLKWSDVNIKAKTFFIADSKNGKTRVVPLNEAVLPLIMYLYTNNPSGCAYVFNQRGEKLGYMNKGFRAACERAGIDNFRFHDLRHTCATRLVLGGASLPVVAAILGHSTTTMTMRYSHPSEQSKQQALEILSSPQRTTSIPTQDVLMQPPATTREERVISYQDQASLWDINQAAKYLKLTSKIILSWVSNRKIPHYKFGDSVRFSKIDIDRWIGTQRIEAV